MISEFILIACILILLAVICLITYARWNYGILESLGIPVVKRTFLLGSTPDLHAKVQHFEDIKRFQKHGSIYGVYEGRNPIIFICDPEIIRLVFVKDFDYFHNRREINLGDPLVNEMLDFLPVDQWREIRGSISPILTSGKIKLMSAAFKESIVEFCDVLKTKYNSSEFQDGFILDIRQAFDGLVMDIICRSAFGIKIGEQLDPNNEFVKMFKELQGSDKDVSFGQMYTWSMVFPFLTKFSPTLQSDSATKIISIVRSIMKSRKESDQRKNDFIDVLNDMMNKLPSEKYQKLQIKETSILAQAINFVLAGYDAMCTAMTVLLYNLAKHPEIQEQLLDEIDTFIDANNGEIIFEKLRECPFLQACLSEALRLAPPFIRPERICTKDWKHKQLRIPKGIVVMVPAWALHRNPEYYEDPEMFNPSRFMPENKTNLNPYAFQSFGVGPRGCFGMQYAYEAMKFSLCHLLNEYRVELSPESGVNYKPGVLFLVMYDPVYLKFVRRR